MASFPWLRSGASQTYAFDAQAARPATQCSRSAVTELMRIARRSVGAGSDGKLAAPNTFALSEAGNPAAFPFLEEDEIQGRGTFGKSRAEAVSALPRLPPG